MADSCEYDNRPLGSISSMDLLRLVEGMLILRQTLNSLRVLA